MSQDYLTVQVRQAGALSHPTDLLALKYAQESHGVDLDAARQLDVARHRLPGEGEHLLVEGPGVAAGAVLFLGVPPLDRFAYREIREFGRRVLAIAAAVRPRSRDISLTLHGPGYGLDESEAFESELGGIFQAVSEGAFPAGLRTVTFVEANARRAERMLAMLEDVPRIPLPRPGLSGSAITVAGDGHGRLRSAGYDADTKEHAFIAMPFADSFDDLFHYGIVPPVRGAGLICERLDELSFTGDVVQRLKERIDAARIVVADLTNANPNVYLEVGYAWGRDIPTVLICDQNTPLTFDVHGQRCLIYRSIRDLEHKLTREIGNLLTGAGPL
ncbi:hypothetical protein [Actinoallomurus acaciae]|uniref:Nucleoside 2-deoxyribosyltransferase n=1 Tax=Actinoallomurus acaciae TaxID=502577 RepID=A0ABV5YAZ9_9ACTN